MSGLSVTHHGSSNGTKTVLVWMHGFLSDQEGEKAAALRDAMLESGRAFTTFDFRGHGKSAGDMVDLTCSGLISDVETVVDDLADRFTNVVLVGSSMGGWAASWFAAKWPERVAATVLIAPAFDFVNLIKEEVGLQRCVEWKRDGVLRLDAGFTQADLGWHLVLDWESYDVEKLREGFRTPTLIIHGMRDESCDWKKSVAFVEQSTYSGFDMMLLAAGDHRLTEYKDRLGPWVDGHLRQRGV